MTGGERPRAPRCGGRPGWVLTPAGHAALGATPGRGVIPRDADERWSITDQGRAALATDPADDLVHEPRAGRQPCDGRGCCCTFPGPRRDGAT